MDSNFRAFWLAPVTRNILGYSLFCEGEKDGASFRENFRRRNWRSVFFFFFFYSSDLVNTKTTIPLSVCEERGGYIRHYSPPLRVIVVIFRPASENIRARLVNTNIFVQIYSFFTMWSLEDYWYTLHWTFCKTPTKRVSINLDKCWNYPIHIFYIPQ